MDHPERGHGAGWVVRRRWERVCVSRENAQVADCEAVPQTRAADTLYRGRHPDWVPEAEPRGQRDGRGRCGVPGEVDERWRHLHEPAELDVLREDRDRGSRAGRLLRPDDAPLPQGLDRVDWQRTPEGPRNPRIVRPPEGRRLRGNLRHP